MKTIMFAGTIRKISVKAYGLTIPVQMIKDGKLKEGRQYVISIKPIEAESSEVMNNESNDNKPEESSSESPQNGSEGVNDNTQETDMDRNPEPPRNLENMH